MVATKNNIHDIITANSIEEMCSGINGVSGNNYLDIAFRKYPIFSETYISIS